MQSWEVGEVRKHQDGKISRCASWRVQSLQVAFGTNDFDDLYALRKGLLEKRQQRGRSARREANQISISFHCRCSLFEMLEVFEMFKMYGTRRVVPWQGTYRGRPCVWSQVCRWRKKTKFHAFRFLLSCFCFDFVVPGFCFFCIAIFLPLLFFYFPTYRDRVTHGLCYTKTLVQTDAFTQTLLHTNPFTKRLRYTQTLWHTFITKTAQYHDATNDTRSLIFSWYFAWNWPKELSTMMLQTTRIISFFMVFPMKFTKEAQYHAATNETHYLICSWYFPLNSPKQLSTTMLQMTGVKQNSSVPSSM